LRCPISQKPSDLFTPSARWLVLLKKFVVDVVDVVDVVVVSGIEIAFIFYLEATPCACKSARKAAFLATFTWLTPHGCHTKPPKKPIFQIFSKII
jgi:hypothetical protein